MLASTAQQTRRTADIVFEPLLLFKQIGQISQIDDALYSDMFQMHDLVHVMCWKIKVRHPPDTNKPYVMKSWNKHAAPNHLQNRSLFNNL